MPVTEGAVMSQRHPSPTVRFLLLAAGALLGLVILGSALPPIATSAAPDDADEAVIVVFRRDARLEGGRGFHQADERARRNPEAWQYVDPDVAGTVQALEATHGFRSAQVYSQAIRGFAGRLTGRQIAALSHDPRVAWIEPDVIVTVQAQTIPWGVDRVNADQSSQRSGNGSGAVTNVNVYVIDTGIWLHPDLNRIRHVVMDATWSNDDCNGHGTHVAGTIGARDNGSDVVGIAPGVPLTGVKVVNCSGSGPISNVIKGVDWVTANARRPAVANLSLSGAASSALDSAVVSSVSSGVFYAVAAGNNGGSACNYSPSRLGTRSGIMTVGATDSGNREASWSNYGSCVDVWAPGVSILSTRRGGGTAVKTGTSMAAPHVTGTAALYLSTHTGARPADVESAIKIFATRPGTSSKDGRGILLDYAGSF